MRNNKRSTPLHQAIHRFLNKFFGSGINRAGCLVEHQHTPIRQNSTRDGEQLPLPLADVACIFVNFHIIATGQGANKMIGKGCFCRSFNLFIGGIRIAITNVFANRAFKQPRILQHHAHHRAQIIAVKFANIVCTNAN